MTVSVPGGPNRSVRISTTVVRRDKWADLIVHTFELVETPAGVSAAGEPPLTPRQRDVLRLIATGLQNKEIATELGLSLATVRNHVHAILDSLGLHSKLEAVALAFRSGWVEMPQVSGEASSRLLILFQLVLDLPRADLQARRRPGTVLPLVDSSVRRIASRSISARVLPGNPVSLTPGLPGVPTAAAGASSVWEADRAASTGSELSTTARSMACSSSRTFPGHGSHEQRRAPRRRDAPSHPCRCASASLRSGNGRPAAGCPRRRSRSGGTAISMTLSR